MVAIGTVKAVEQAGRIRGSSDPGGQPGGVCRSLVLSTCKHNRVLLWRAVPQVSLRQSSFKMSFFVVLGCIYFRNLVLVDTLKMGSAPVPLEETRMAVTSRHSLALPLAWPCAVQLS